MIVCGGADLSNASFIFITAVIDNVVGAFGGVCTTGCEIDNTPVSAFNVTPSTAPVMEYEKRRGCMPPKPAMFATSLFSAPPSTTVLRAAMLIDIDNGPSSAKTENVASTGGVPGWSSLIIKRKTMLPVAKAETAGYKSSMKKGKPGAPSIICAT